MKIGIISKEAHAKSHAKMLEDKGHEVVLLGGNTVVLPDSLDVIVCRVVSCSHTASKYANTARREGRTVVFEDSVSGLRKAIEALETAETGEEAPKENHRPIKGVFFRGYYDSRGYWSIKSGPKWRTHHSSLKCSRAETEKRIAEMDELRLNNQKVPKGDIGPMDGAGDYGHEMKEAQSSETKPREKTTPELEQDLNELMVMVEETMTKLGLTQMSRGLLKIERLKMHLVSPNGPACGSARGPHTKELDKVTCRTCKNSNIFSTAQWVLANLKA